MIRKTVLVLVAGAALVAAAVASTHSSAGSYGLHAAGHQSTFDFQKPAYSFGYRTQFTY